MKTARKSISLTLDDRRINIEIFVWITDKGYGQITVRIPIDMSARMSRKTRAVSVCNDLCYCSFYRQYRPLQFRCIFFIK